MACRLVAAVLIGSFALFAGTPAWADMILASAAESSQPSEVGGVEPGRADGAASADGAVYAADVTASGSIPQNPDEGERAGCVTCAAAVGAVLVVGAVLFVISSSYSPTPGW